MQGRLGDGYFEVWEGDASPRVTLETSQGRKMVIKMFYQKEQPMMEPMLFIIGIGRTPTIVEIEILGRKLTNAIVDGGSGVNVLPEVTWQALGKPMLWPPTFHLVGVDQLGIKPLGTLMGQKVIMGTQ